MSKKLLIAVLLGLLFAFVGNAVADFGDDAELRQTTNPNAPEYGQRDAVQLKNHAQRYGRPPAVSNEAIRLVSPPVLAPIPRICDTIGYAVNWTWLFGVPRADIPRQYLGMRFSRAEGYAACTLKVVHIAYYPDYNTGTPDMQVDIWDDVLGYPGSIIGTVTVPYASLPATAGYVDIDFTSQNIVVAGDFYVSLTSPTAGAQIVTVGDDGTAGQCRSYVHDAGQWYTRCELGFTDYNFDFIVDICCIDPAFTDCFPLEYYCNIFSGWFLPSATGTRQYAGQRFTAPGFADTLVDVYFAIDTVYAGVPDIDVWVTPVAAGFPDMSSPLYYTQVPNASVLWYNYNVVTMPPNLVVSGDFYVVLGASNGQTVIYDDDGTCGELRSVFYNPTVPEWKTMYDRYGYDDNFVIGVDFCRDIYSECGTVAFDCTPTTGFSLPATTGSGRIGLFQRIDAAGVGSKLGKVRCPVWTTGFAIPATNSWPAEIRVYSNDGVGGAPGTLLGSIGVNAPYPDYPPAIEVDFSSMNIRFDGWVYVGIVTLKTPPTAPNDPDFYAVASNPATCGGLGFTVYGLKSDGSWLSYAGYTYLAQADICSVPVPERTCTPGESWPTSGHDFRRTGASMNSTGDAKCKQTLLWATYDASGYVYARPVIYDTVVVVCANNRLRGYGINGGQLMWTITGLPVLGSNVRIQPTVKDGYVYFGGGSNRGFSKADVYTGAVAWSRNPLNLPFAGNTVYTSSVILTVGGTEVVYLSTANGEVYALDAMTGLNYAGFNAGAPLILDGDPLHTLSSNGVDKIYVATDGLFGTGYGTMYAIDAATGAIDWQLGESGLLGHDIDSDTGANIITLEIFQSPLAVDADGAIYALTSFNSEIDGTPSGARYRISPAGSVVWGKPGAFGRFAGPIIDANYVYMTQLRGWTAEPVNGAGVALKKTTGATVFNTDPAFDGMAWVEGALSCEPGGVPDIWYRTNQTFQMIATNTVDGMNEFEYNWDIINAAATPQRGCGVAIDPTHVVFNTRQGDLFVLANGINDRPRLRILKTDELYSVPFFSPNPTYVTYDDVFMNNGCANLTGTISADEIAPAYVVTSVHPDRISRLANAADAMVTNSYAEMVKAIPVDKNVSDPDFDSSPLFRDSYSNKAAYAPPAWLNGIVVSAFNLAPGQTFDVQYDVNGPLVTRGPHYCYVTISSNDQYYLNSLNAPVVQLGVLGGCTEEYAELHWGTGTQNAAPVYPTGELASQELGILWEIDGDNAPFWQGSLWYMAGQYRLAWNSDTWHGGDAPNFWNSLLPDINACNQCAPVVTPNAVIFGYKWDGAGYNTAVSGNVAYTRYIDSVVNFDCFGTGWDWRGNIACPYDDTLSMGLMIDSWMYGVVGDAVYNNVVIWRLDIKNRNAVALPGVYLGAYNDMDLTHNGLDVVKFLPSHSIGWGFSCNDAGAKMWGMGKIPMDTDPMIGTRTIDQNQGMWHADDVALDSMYLWATTQPGETWQAGIINGPGCGASGDRAFWFSFVGHDFAPSETYTTGVYLFGYGAFDETDTTAIEALALSVNQLAGFGRGDINGDNVVNLADVVALANGTDHAVFAHLADVNASGGAPDAADVIYLANFWFCAGPGPVGAWVLPTAICP